MFFIIFLLNTFVYKLQSKILPTVYDYIVIGSGPGGGPIAARLVLQDYKVLVIEAGPDDLTYSSPNSSDFTSDYPFIPQTTMLDNTGFFMYGKPDINWGNPTVPVSTQSGFWNDSKLTGRVDTASRAKILGGCSTHNLQAWNRGGSEDFDYVESSLELNGWGWKNMLPYFNKLETYLGNNKTLRGTNGPITVTPRVLRSWNKKNEKLINAGINYGLPVNNNWQAGSQRGIGLLDISHQPCDHEIGYCNGIAYGSTFKRQSSSESYLRKLIHQNNKQTKLTILTNCIARRILFDANKKAIGINFYDKDKTSNIVYINNNGEIIIAAGAYQSPQLLMLSGIGPRSELTKHQIPIIHESPKVGQNYTNHLYLPIIYEINDELYENSKTQPLSYSQTISGINNDTLAVMQMFLKSGTYILDNNNDISDHGIYNNYNDIRIECWADGVNFSPLTVEIDTKKSIICYIDPQIYSLAGQILLKSNSIYDYPLLYPNYFFDERDFRGFIWAINETRKIFSQDKVSFIKELLPGDSIQSYQELKNFILTGALDSAHPHATLSMGNTEYDAVDSQCRVNGITGVRVTDASIWPRGSNSNPAALVFAISERCAQFLIDEKNAKNNVGKNMDNGTKKNENTINIVLLSVIICLLVVVIIFLVLIYNKMNKKNQYQRVYRGSSDQDSDQNL